jgi:aspartate carbamoyltransferase catalytic subunit
MPLRHVITAQQFNRTNLRELFREADFMEKLCRDGNCDLLHGKLMGSVFYEPSTRTRFCFEAAMLRMGGSVITTENAAQFSSAAKGESLEDTVRTVGQFVDVTIFRHVEAGAALKASKKSPVPLINAGDGPGQHPTQALLDLYTIQREIGHIDGITVSLVGDLLYGRAVHSLAYLLGKYKIERVYLVAPTVVRMKPDLKAYLKRHNVPYTETQNLMKAASASDIIYSTRIQRERFGENTDLADQTMGQFKINNAVMDVMKPEARLMHPFPRNEEGGEIDTEVDDDPRAAYFRQIRNGLYVRMALLKMLLIRNSNRR